MLIKRINNVGLKFLIYKLVKICYWIWNVFNSISYLRWIVCFILLVIWMKRFNCFLNSCLSW